MRIFPSWFKYLSVVIHFLFWILNVPLAFTVLNFVVGLAFSALNPGNPGQFQWSEFSRMTQTIPTDVVVTLLVFFAMPVVVLVAVIASKTYRQPTKLLQILFGVELPIMAFTLARLVFLKTLTPVNIVFLSSAAISVLAYAIYLLAKPAKNKFLLTLHVWANQLAVVIGAYASLLMFFFLPIVLAWIVQIVSSIFEYGLFRGLSYSEGIWQIITGLAAMTAFSSLFLALISSPFIGFYLYWRATRRLSHLLELRTNRATALLSHWGFSLVYVVIVASLAYQGSLFQFYNQFDRYQSATTFEQRSEVANKILKQEHFVANRLVEVYLSNYRYLTDTSMTLLQEGYIDQVKVDEPTAERLQNWFVALASPFVYNGKFEEDVKKAGEAYQEIFDEPIQLAESQKVAQTLESSFNFSPDPMKSSVLDRTDKDVRLVQRIVTAQPDATRQFATVTVEEEYENKTTSEQEVLYVFSLPQDSVMTDLKLGADLELGKEQLEMAATPLAAAVTPSPTTSTTGTTQFSAAKPIVIPSPVEHKDQGQVAAKGAADQTFNDQYARRLDPAILEQVGPVQYKLRIYPIPVQEANLSEWQRDRLLEPVKNQKVRYSYVTALDAQGQAALPDLTESRNIFSDGRTTVTYRSADGSVKSLSEKAPAVSVLTRSETDCGSQPTTLTRGLLLTMYVPHSVNPWLKTDGIEFTCQNQLAGAEQKVINQRIAVLADASYSMGVKNWQTYLNQELPLADLLDKNVVDLYYFNDLVSQPINLNAQRNNPKIFNQVAFGQTDRLHALKQIAGKYDLVLMFTDGSEADTPGEKNFVPSLAQPIYVINKNGVAPKLPDNLTYYLQANQARVVSSGTAALQDFAVRQTVQKQLPGATVLVGEAGTWITLPAVDAAKLSAISAQPVSLNEPVAKLAIHRQIESDMQTLAASLNTLATLDELNATAQASGIVTPFSSFIVLTTEQQKEQLRQASLREGRYSVNYDLGEQALIQPSAGGLLGTSAVPEPHEWALLLTGGGILLYLSRERWRAFLVRRHA